MWRQAVLIQLYQDIYQLGPMAKKVQTALDQILHLSTLISLTETEQNPHIDSWDMAMVWFLACTVAIKEEHRSTCLENLESISSE